MTTWPAVGVDGSAGGGERARQRALHRRAPACPAVDDEPRGVAPDHRRCRAFVVGLRMREDERVQLVDPRLPQRSRIGPSGGPVSTSTDVAPSWISVSRPGRCPGTRRRARPLAGGAVPAPFSVTTRSAAAITYGGLVCQRRARRRGRVRRCAERRIRPSAHAARSARGTPSSVELAAAVRPSRGADCRGQVHAQPARLDAGRMICCGTVSSVHR